MYVLRVDKGCVLRVSGGMVGVDLYYLMLVHVVDIGSNLYEALYKKPLLLRVRVC